MTRKAASSRRPVLVEEFGEESSIHGFRFLLCDRHRQRRAFFVLWTFIVLVCTGAAIWYVGSSIYQYYQFGVKTTTSTDVAKDEDFPAITFANENRLRKSVVSGSQQTMLGLVAYLAPSADEIPTLLRSTMASCYDPTRNDNLTKRLDRGYEFWTENGFIPAAAIVMPDSFSDVRGCWWQDRIIDCSQLFLNHMCDHGWCFTFNPNREIIRQTALGKLNRMANGYGVRYNYTNFKLVAAGQRSGVRFLININHDDYCVTRQRLAGYHVLVHNSRIQPIFSLDSPLLLSPGFSTSVAIRLNKYTRKTESIGRCVRSKFLSMQPNATVYFREACYLQCIAEQILRDCDCYIAYAPIGSFVIADQLYNGSLAFCWGPKVTCSQKSERPFFEAGVGSKCDDDLCPVPCEEIKYTTQATAAYFPPLHDAEAYARSFGFASVEKFRQNFLMVEFYVESLLMVTVEEERELELIDLISSIGGIIGFYLGMSIMSLLEVVQILLLLTWPTLANVKPATTEPVQQSESKRENTRRMRSRTASAISGHPQQLRATRNALPRLQLQFFDDEPTIFRQDERHSYLGSRGYF